jgi:hypothetical protein
MFLFFYILFHLSVFLLSCFLNSHRVLFNAEWWRIYNFKDQFLFLCSTWYSYRQCKYHSIVFDSASICYYFILFFVISIHKLILIHYMTRRILKNNLLINGTLEIGSTFSDQLRLIDLQFNHIEDVNFDPQFNVSKVDIM